MLSTRVTVENTGKLPLTNVHVQYLNNPGGIKLAPADVLDRLEPGEKAHFSRSSTCQAAHTWQW